mmetsp:Transcript_6916/g.23618  ORF Transcript_6916/g.23618 Transcript_6916/m.23618 type:complete len:206 (-) Transcript_6916:117-734(-)
MRSARDSALPHRPLGAGGQHHQRRATHGRRRHYPAPVPGLHLRAPLAPARGLQPVPGQAGDSRVQTPEVLWRRTPGWARVGRPRGHHGQRGDDRRHPPHRWGPGAPGPGHFRHRAHLGQPRRAPLWVRGAQARAPAAVADAGCGRGGRRRGADADRASRGGASDGLGAAARALRRSASRGGGRLAGGERCCVACMHPHTVQPTSC